MQRNHSIRVLLIYISLIILPATISAHSRGQYPAAPRYKQPQYAPPYTQAPRYNRYNRYPDYHEHGPKYQWFIQLNPEFSHRSTVAPDYVAQGQAQNLSLYGSIAFGMIFKRNYQFGIRISKDIPVPEFLLKATNIFTDTPDTIASNTKVKNIWTYSALAAYIVGHDDELLKPFVEIEIGKPIYVYNGEVSEKVKADLIYGGGIGVLARFSKQVGLTISYRYMRCTAYNGILAATPLWSRHVGSIGIRVGF